MNRKEVYKMIRKVCVTMLCVMIAVTFMPAPAFAKNTDSKTLDPTGKYYQEIKIDPYTYYDVGKGSKQTLDDTVLTGLVKDHLISDWSYVANRCFADAGKCATIDTDRYEHCFFTDDAYYNCFGNIRKVLTGEAKDKGSPKGNNLMGTGVKMASSLGEVRQIMAQRIRDQVGRSTVKTKDILARGPVPPKQKDPSALYELDDDTNQPVVYSIATSVNATSACKYIYNSFGIAFYNFHPVPIEADDLVYKGAGDGYNTAEEAVQAGVQGVSYDKETSHPVGVGATNDTSEPSNQSYTRTDTQESTVSNSTSSATSFSWGSSVHIDGTWGAAGGTIAIDTLAQWSAGISFNFNSMYENSESHTNSDTQKTDHSVTASMDLPPQTLVQMTSDHVVGQMSQDYDTPVMISYSVAVFSITGDVYADDAASCYYDTIGYEHGCYLNTFGSILGQTEQGKTITVESANENLHLRAVENKKTGRNDASSNCRVHRWYNKVWGSDYDTTTVGTDWDKKVFKAADDNTRAQKAISSQAVKIPMMSCGCTFLASMEKFKQSVGQLVPLYLPAYFELNKGLGQYELATGDSLNASAELGVACMNRNDVPYYGFKPKDGHWVACDANGTPMDSDVIEMSEDGAGFQTVTAKKAGIGYITWKIRDGVKYTADESGTITVADNLDAPKIEITVKDEPFEGSLSVTGDFKGCVGDKDVNLNDCMSVTAYDKTGKQVNVPIAWEQQELPEKGLVVAENGDVTMSQAGDFHIRAAVRNTGAGTDDVYSDWIPITVREARQLTAVDLVRPATDEAVSLIAEPASTNHRYELDSYLKGYDQYGDEWTGGFEDVSYELSASDKDNGYLDGRHLCVSGEGKFEVTPVLNGQSGSSFKLVAADNIACSSAKIDLKVGQSKKISVNDFSGKPFTGELTFASEDPEIASVSEDGTVKGLSKGFAVIVIRDSVGGEEACQVFVDEAAKKANTLTVKGKTATVKHSKLKKKNQTVKRAKAISISKAKGTVTYAKASGNKKITINKKTGNVTVKKGLKKGTYKVKVKVTASGNSDFKKAVKKVTIKVRVK